MAAANFLWLYFLNNRRTIQSGPTYVNISYDPEPIPNSFLSIIIIIIIIIMPTHPTMS